MRKVFDKICKERGITAYAVAKGTGIRTSTIYEWTTGKYNIKIDKVQKIADFLGVPIETFLKPEVDDET